MFYFRQIHAKFPNKHILVCEDVLEQQIKIMQRLAQILPNDGSVEISVVPGAIAAANLVNSLKIDLIIADHDMSNGNASDFLKWMKTENKSIPVITASGIPQNNYNMIQLGANHCFTKQEVIDGKADEIIKNYLSS